MASEATKLDLNKSPVVRKQIQLLVDAIADQGRRRMKIGGYPVFACNAPAPFASMCAEVMAKGVLFGVAYYDRADRRRVFVLKSTGNVDVGAVARTYRGDGTPSDAEFTQDTRWEGE